MKKMKSFVRTLIFLVAFIGAKCDLYKFNDNIDARMPPIYHMDDYDGCLKQNRDVFCTATFGLKSERSNELLSFIEEYSEFTSTHFNHSNLRYGLCVTKRCYNFNKDEFAKNQTPIIEKCLNDLFMDAYDLKAMVTEIHCSEFENASGTFDALDVFVAVIVIAILSAAFIGTSVDILMANNNYKANPFILAFSIKRNWKHLTAGSDPDSGSFKSLHGIKILLFCSVVMAHTFVPVVNTANNIITIEESYNNLARYVLFGGTIVVQTFFVISGMLLIYKIQVNKDKMSMNFYFLPKIVALRWLRLTPLIIITIAIISSWLRYTKSGPLWEIAMGTEISDCRQRGWLGLLYLNNYINNSQCLPHTWYLAADMQLFCLGILLYQLAWITKAKKTVLSVTFIVGLILPAIHTYAQDLDALILISPENAKLFFGDNPTFNEVYKRGHTNIPSYVVGLALGYIIHHLKVNNFNVEKYKSYRIIYWCIIPASISLMLLGSIFYNDAPRPPIYLRVLYATFAKPLFAVMVAILILGMTFKYENIYRKCFEWDMWLPLSRLSYAAYVIHFVFMRMYTSTITTLIDYSIVQNSLLVLSFISVSFLAAVPLWLLVEAPVNGLVKLYIDRNFNKQNKRKTTYNICSPNGVRDKMD